MKYIMFRQNIFDLQFELDFFKYFFLYIPKSQINNRKVLLIYDNFLCFTENFILKINEAFHEKKNLKTHINSN